VIRHCDEGVSPKKQSPQRLVEDALAERSCCFSDFVEKLFIAVPTTGEIASPRDKTAVFAMTEFLKGKKKHGFLGRALFATKHLSPSGESETRSSDKEVISKCPVIALIVSILDIHAHIISGSNNLALQNSPYIYELQISLMALDSTISVMSQSEIASSGGRMMLSRPV
jgi:hypothetical protein